MYHSLCSPWLKQERLITETRTRLRNQSWVMKLWQKACPPRKTLITAAQNKVLIAYLLFVADSVSDELQALWFIGQTHEKHGGRKEEERKSNNGKTSKTDDRLDIKNSYADCVLHIMACVCGWAWKHLKALGCFCLLFAMCHPRIKVWRFKVKKT